MELHVAAFWISLCAVQTDKQCSLTFNSGVDLNTKKKKPLERGLANSRPNSGFVVVL